MNEHEKNSDDNETNYEKVYRKREMDTKIDYITDKLDQLHKLAKDNLAEARKTNGRVTTLEEKVGELEQLPEQVENNTRQISFWRGSTYIIGALLVPVLLKVVTSSIL